MKNGKRVAYRKKLKHIMVRIINNSQVTLQPSAQQAIQNAAAWAELESEVTAVLTNENTGNEPIFDVYDENDNYSFSIDTDNNTVFSR